MIDLVLAFTFAVAFPLITSPVYNRRRPQLQAGDWTVKRQEYLETILWLASMGAATVLVWWWQQRSFAELGFDLSCTWQIGASLAIAVVVIALLVFQVRLVRRDSSYQEAARDAMHSVDEFLPHNDREAKWFRGVSVAAGVGEEIFYRGFLIWYLSSFLHIWLAVALSSVLFGLAHIMHGTQATIRATITGLLFAILYLFSGALWAPILLHAAVDLTSGEVGLAALRDRTNSGDSE